MSRLADYFVVVGYDHAKERSGVSCGKIIQRFPERDWDDCPFTQGIELFCQPAGWRLYTTRQQPTFYVSVLTDIDAERHYCACLTFTEDVVETSVPTTVDEEGEEQEHDPALVRHSKMFAPKSMVLVSRLDYCDTFRNCLGIIFTVYIENQQVQLETLIGNILGCIHVPLPGGPQVRFSIGAGDKQALQPPLTNTLPVTRATVAMLFQQMGISNTLSLFCAGLTDHKILFHSSSYSRLTEASHALTSLMYPLKYSYVYIPLLPAGLFEVLTTPTPFIAGVHSSLKAEFIDLLDVIIADLDGGSIHVPEHVTLPLMPEPMRTRVVQALQMILHIELQGADFAFPPPPPKPSAMDITDKEVRAVFLRFFAEMFFGYRSCLTIIRIHPEPFITFHKANFLGHRGLVEDEFVSRVLDSMSFSAFVVERGPPFRVCDLFDEVFASMQDKLKIEAGNPEKMLQHVRELGHQLYMNETPNPQPYVQKIPRPTEGAYNRIHQPPFPNLDMVHIHEIIEEGLQKHSIKSKLSQIRPMQPRIVPIGPHVSSAQDRYSIVSTNARRLEVLRNCVNFVFDNKISDARKIFPAVLRALKSKVARLALVEELGYHVQSNRAMLEHQQFDMVVRLLNCALQNDSSMDENGVAAAILPLATSFCRKLCTGVIQFAYTCVQEHAVWANHQFWDATFYQDVQKQIRQLYAPQYEEHLHINTARSPGSNRESKDSNHWKSGSTPDSKRRIPSTQSMFKPREISALEIAAEQMRIWPNLSKSDQSELINNEESIVYSQAIHYANRMVYMRVPLDASKSLREAAVPGMEGESTSSNVTNSVAESDSFDAESGFDEQEVSEVGNSVVRFVSRFVDKVCTESSVTQEHIKALHQMIPGVVAMHIETLEAVHRESKRLPPIQKPKILTPTLLPGEEIVMTGLRVYLIPDGREEGMGGNMGGPPLLPAEGAIFLTTYRVLFKGTPCDPLACEMVVCRSFPVATLTREKKMSVQYLAHIDQWLQEGLQLRSNTFQLMKVAFDEEVSTEDIETLRKLVNKVRNPTTVHNTFAFTGLLNSQPTPLHKHKEKNASLNRGPFTLDVRKRDKKSATLHTTMFPISATSSPSWQHVDWGFAKRTLMKTAKKAGLKSKDSNRKHKYVLPTPPVTRRSTTAMEVNHDRPSSACFDDELQVIDEAEITLAIQTDAKNVDRLAERAYCRDYQRLGLGSLTGTTRSRTEPFRLSLVNSSYGVCRSYPAVLVVPQSVSDDSIRKFSRSHRQYRFPVVTWRHPKHKAVLLRASGFHGKGVMGMLKGHHNTQTAPPSSSTSEMSTSVEQEKYFSALVAATPMGNHRYAASISDSLTSLDSLVMSAATGEPLVLPDTPDSARRNPLARAVSSLRSSGSKAKTLGRITSLRDKRHTGSLQYGASLRQNGSIDMGDLTDIAPQSFHKAVLYVLGEKTQMKGIKIESFPKCDFIPVDYYEVRHVKSAFKKLMRACVPSAPYTDPQRGFLRAIEESEWLPQLTNILQIAGAIVDLLDVQGSSVMMCLEDGWDFTTQVVSVAQVLLDPYYRTIDGFRTLVEKEWLSHGHRFTHRSNQTAANQASGFAPVFLQFLDVVHQVHEQFPLSFEFNQYYLKFIAFHYVSNRFRTFMLDNEYERVESGWLFDDRHKHKLMDGGTDGEPGYSPKHSASTTSVWDYIEKHNKRSPIFHNFMFSPLDQETVLRPYSNASNLKIWDYYLKEDLAHGPSFDLEVVAKEMKMQEDQDLMDGPLQPSSRKILNACYDNIEQLQPDVFTHLLQEFHRIECELNRLPQKWRPLWDKLEHPPRETLTRQVSFNTQIVRSHGRSIHKRSTIELLVKGKMLGEAAKMFSQPHHFEKFIYTTPAYCDYCSHFLWGLVKTGMRCAECGYNCHEKCMPHVPKNCTKLRPMSEVSTTSAATLNKASISETSSITGEHRTHEGYLFKRGALLKGWKRRFFVLDSVKHQLRYYDAREDTNCKGFIELAEVVSVAPLKNVQGAPKKADENAFFEMKTERRIYNFLAEDASSAQDWIDKIQSCIQ